MIYFLLLYDTIFYSLLYLRDEFIFISSMTFPQIELFRKSPSSIIKLIIELNDSRLAAIYVPVSIGGLPLWDNTVNRVSHQSFHNRYTPAATLGIDVDYHALTPCPLYPSVSIFPFLALISLLRLSDTNFIFI